MDTDFAATAVGRFCETPASDTDALQFRSCASAKANKTSLRRVPRRRLPARTSFPPVETQFADEARALRASQTRKDHTQSHRTKTRIQVGSTSTQRRGGREKIEFHSASFRRSRTASPSADETCRRATANPASAKGLRRLATRPRRLATSARDRFLRH